MDVNFSRNRNKVLSLPDGTEIQYGSGPGHMVGLGTTQLLKEGYPVGSFYGWVYEGVYQEGDDFLLNKYQAVKNLKTLIMMDPSIVMIGKL